MDESNAVLESRYANNREPEDRHPANERLRFPEYSQALWRAAKVTSADASSGPVLYSSSGCSTTSAAAPVCVSRSIAGIGGRSYGSADNSPASLAPFPGPKVHHETAPGHYAPGNFNCPARTLTAESALPRPRARLLILSILSRQLQAHPRPATSSFVMDSRGGLRKIVCDSPEAR